MLAKYYTEIMKIQLREFKRLSKAHDRAIDQLMRMNEPDNMQSHITQRYWQTHNKIEQSEKEMRTIIEELNELEKRFHWLNMLHQERFHFLTEDAQLFQRIVTLMNIYKQEEKKNEKLLLATEDYIMVTPELFNDLNNVKLDLPLQRNPYIVKVPHVEGLPTTVLDMEVKVMDYNTWTKYDGITQEKLKLEVKTKLYEAEEEFKKQQNHYNTILKQLKEWNQVY